MIGAVHSGYASIQSGMRLMDSSAGAIARQGVVSSESGNATSGGTSSEGRSMISPTGDVTQALLEQRQALYQVQAGAKIIQTSDKALGSLLDALA
ncbi:MAG: flagellar biosynthesis protein FlgE [Candidatus Competibacter sp.]|nr:flagellar biosynthesis protein FlgE [Candidatus Competibacteraceae bacterium]